MVDIGLNNLAIAGPVAKLTIDGKIHYSAENWTLRGQFKVLEEPVSNSNIPYYGTSTYHGEFDCDAIATTDDDFFALGIGQWPFASGDITTKTAILNYKSEDGTASTTYTFTGRINEFESQQRKGEFVRSALKMVLNAVPVKS